MTIHKANYMRHTTAHHLSDGAYALRMTSTGTLARMLRHKRAGMALGGAHSLLPGRVLEILAKHVLALLELRLLTERAVCPQDRANHETRL